MLNNAPTPIGLRSCYSDMRQTFSPCHVNYKCAVLGWLQNRLPARPSFASSILSDQASKILMFLSMSTSQARVLDKTKSNYERRAFIHPPFSFTFALKLLISWAAGLSLQLLPFKEFGLAAAPVKLTFPNSTYCPLITSRIVTTASQAPSTEH